MICIKIICNTRPNIVCWQKLNSMNMLMRRSICLVLMPIPSVAEGKLIIFLRKCHYFLIYYSTVIILETLFYEFVIEKRKKPFETFTEENRIEVIVWLLMFQYDFKFVYSFSWKKNWTKCCNRKKPTRLKNVVLEKLSDIKSPFLAINLCSLFLIWNIFSHWFWSVAEIYWLMTREVKILTELFAIDQM